MENDIKQSAVNDLESILALSNRRIDFEFDEKLPFFDPCSVKLHGGRRVILLMPDANGVLPFVIEPFTWTWVALQIAEGILAALGAMIFNKLFASNVNFERIQNETISRLSVLFRESLQAESLRKAEALVRTSQRIASDYSNAPETSADRLSTLTTITTELVYELASLGLAASGAYCVAINMRMAVLQERMIRLKDNGEKLNIVQSCDEGISHIQDIFIVTGTRNKSRFSPIYVNPDIGYYYLVDKKRHWGGKDGGFTFIESEATQTREKHIRSLWSETYGDHADDLAEIMAKLQDIKRQFG